MSSSAHCGSDFVLGYLLTVKFFFETNGILAQKNYRVGVVDEKTFALTLRLHREFLPLSSVEKITATGRVQSSIEFRATSFEQAVHENCDDGEPWRVRSRLEARGL